MSFLGMHLTVWIGKSVPAPAPPMFLEVLESVEVTHSDEGRSGFQVILQMGRSGPLDLVDFRLIKDPLLNVYNRVLLMVTFGASPRVLMDGIITRTETSPSNEPGSSRLTITGEDVSVMMDLEEKSEEHPAQMDSLVALKIIASYAQYGLIPMVIPPSVIDPPIPIDRIPVQQETDLGHLQNMAKRHGYVFYVIPGPAPLTNTAYWGPPLRVGVPQRALSMNMGPDTNVEDISFSNNSMAPTTLSGKVQDRLTNQVIPVVTPASTRLPLSLRPAWAANFPNVRTKQFRASGLTAIQALARAQGEMDASQDQVVTASGTLDALRYGGLLKPRELVGVRGVGYTNDGFYYVKSVKHIIRKEAYKQQFVLTREGTGSTTPFVIP